MDEPLSSRNLARYGLRRGAYNGGNGRRFVLFQEAVRHGERVEVRWEYDSKAERDARAMQLIKEGTA